MRLCALRLIATGWKVLLPLPLTVAVVVVTVVVIVTVVGAIGIKVVLE